MDFDKKSSYAYKMKEALAYYYVYKFKDRQSESPGNTVSCGDPRSLYPQYLVTYKMIAKTMPLLCM